jgi:glycerol-3-phosphate dehydrogenase
MWEKGWRDRVWSGLDQKWDLIIIGGGITGAGVFREAARKGLHVLLVEAHDFASGTSSRSSKMVHGGFRYLKNGQIKVVIESVRERERLLSEGRGLVIPLGVLLADYVGDAIPAWVFGAGLILYDLLALKWGHRHYDAYDMHEMCPSLSTGGLQGGFRYFDAQTDDARLVLRLIQEAVIDQGLALNYTRVIGLLPTKTGRVGGVVLQDLASEGQECTIEVQAPIVINATGAWADDLRTQVGGSTRLRKLRGSHLILPASRLPLTRSISFLHPDDNRPVFAFPWEGVILVGTTDVDLDGSLETDPSISQAETQYLLQAVQYAFPDQELSIDDIQSTLAGIRPVIDTGKADPSKESREFILWNENGLLTVTGGKLTTFRLMAHEALRKVRAVLPGRPRFEPRTRVLDLPPAELITTFQTDRLTPALRMRLLGRYGANTPAMIDVAKADELETIGTSYNLWAELRWAARAEGVVHLDDLLLRRLRIGLTLPQGGFHFMDRIRSIAQPELGWDDQRWEQEVSDYKNLWKKCYYLYNT